LAALEIVRQGADVMPKSQLNQVLDAELGANWSSKLSSFDYQPMAAASIGQVVNVPIPQFLVNLPGGLLLDKRAKICCYLCFLTIQLFFI